MDAIIHNKDADAFVNALGVGGMGLSFEEMEEFMRKCLSRVVTMKAAQQKKRSLEGSQSLEGDVATYHVVDSAMFMEPRGRFKVSMSSGGLTLDGKTACFVPWRQVAYAMQLPCHQTSKKEGEDMISFRTHEPIEMSNGKKLSNFLWKLSRDPKAIEDASKAPVPGGMETHELIGTQSVVVHAIFRRCWDRVLDGPKSNVFQTMQKNPKPYLQCYKGIQEGVLYPLATGILFVKPMVFLSAAEIDGIVAGRGGSAQTRYVDLQIQTLDGSTYEFTNIDRDELPALQGYVQYVLVESKRRLERAESSRGEGMCKKMIKTEDGPKPSSSSSSSGAASDEGPAGPIDLARDDDSDEDDDDDYDPNAPDSDEDDGDAGNDDDSEDGDSEDDEDYEPEDVAAADDEGGDEDTASESGKAETAKVKTEEGDVADCTMIV